MDTELFAEKIILFIEGKINEEYQNRYKYRNTIYSTVLDGMEDNIDAFGTIWESITRYDNSKSRTRDYYEILYYIQTEMKAISNS